MGGTLLPQLPSGLVHIQHVGTSHHVIVHVAMVVVVDVAAAVFQTFDAVLVLAVAIPFTKNINESNIYRFRRRC